MNNTYFISDLHYSDETQANRRGFNSTEEMNQMIIDNWNSIVSDEDLVYILGDLNRSTPEYEFLSLLKGRKRVILGNHENPSYTWKLLEYADSIASSIEFRGVLATHIPPHESQVGRYRHILHGHTHYDFIKDYRYINTCAEVLNYCPMTLEALIERQELMFKFGTLE